MDQLCPLCGLIITPTHAVASYRNSTLSHETAYAKVCRLIKWKEVPWEEVPGDATNPDGSPFGMGLSIYKKGGDVYADSQHLECPNPCKEASNLTRGGLNPNDLAFYASNNSLSSGGEEDNPRLRF